MSNVNKIHSTKLSNWKLMIVYGVVAIVTVVLDQVSKHIMGKVLEGDKVINVLGDWLTFRWTLNDGGAFGRLSGANVLFFVVTLIGLPGFGFFLWRSLKRSRWGQIGFCFMIGGTIGNAIDRMFLGDGFFNGSVRDFIAVKGFAVFNIADSFLVVGVIMVCLALLFFDFDAVFKPTKKNEEKSAKDDN